MKTIIYIPVCCDKNGDYFRVNGATDRDRDSAIRKASRHFAVKDGGKIVRIDGEEIEDEYRPI